MLSKLTHEFTFAGFSFPKHVWDMPRGDFAKRIQRMHNTVTGGYYHAPKPITHGANPGMSFYLESDGMPGLRWQWADEVVDLRHTGWFCDEYGDGDKLRGIVMRLPHGRGFLAGWSMGEGMASEVDGCIHDDLHSAAHIADGMAEQAAEREREYQAQQQAEQDAAAELAEAEEAELWAQRDVATI